MKAAIVCCVSSWLAWGKPERRWSEAQAIRRLFESSWWEQPLGPPSHG